MRTLFVSMDFPDDLRTRVHGVFKRQEMFVDAFKGLGGIDFLFFVEPRIDLSLASVDRYRAQLAEHYQADITVTLAPRHIPVDRSRWESYGASTLDAYRQYKFRAASGPAQVGALNHALERDPDALFIHRLSPMAAVERLERPVPPMFFDLDDVEHRSFARSIPQPPSWPGKRLYYLQLPALWLAERRAIKASRRTFVCSELDRRYLSRTMLVDGVTVVPNSVVMPEPREPAPGPTAMFLGALGYGPNWNAATWLIEDIWPRVRLAMPSAELLIAGKDGEDVPGYPGGSGVTFTGFVEDLDELYDQTQVVCVPIQSGGGTRFKIIEAAGYGRPIVSTTIGAEGLAMEDGKHILLRDSAEDFADAIVQLMSDEERGRALGLAGRDAVYDTYSRDNVVKKIREEVRSALG